MAGSDDSGRAPMASIEPAAAAATMSEAVVVVGGWASPFVTRVFVALRLKCVEYEFLQEPVGNKSELLLRSNPVYRKMPVLLHGGRPVCESLVILQYVDEAFSAAGKPILPADPYHRAVHRFWAEYADTKHFGVLRAMVGGDKADAAEQVSAALRQLEEAFVECSGGKRYFGGDDVGFLDIVVGSYIGWFGAAERIAGLPVLDEASTPRLAAWAVRFCAHEAVGDLVPDAGRLVEFGEVLRAALAASASSRP